MIKEAGNEMRVIEAPHFEGARYDRIHRKKQGGAGVLYYDSTRQVQVPLGISDTVANFAVRMHNGLHTFAGNLGVEDDPLTHYMSETTHQVTMEIINGLGEE